MEKLIEVRAEPGWLQLPFGIVRPSKEGLSWIRGIRGELLMARRLERLGPEWTVLHSVPVGERGSDIDHLLVGPAGVFPINAKRHVDKRVSVGEHLIFVDGHRTEHVRNSALEATRVEAVLRRNSIVAPILPVVAISGAKQISGRREATWKGQRVGVVAVDGLVSRLRRRPPKLSERDVARISYLFRDSATWTTRVVQPTDPVELRKSYDAIWRGVTRWNVMLAICILTLAVIVGVLVSNVILPALPTTLTTLTP